MRDDDELFCYENYKIKSMRNIVEINNRRCIINSTVNDWEFMDDFLLSLCKVDRGYYMYSIKDGNGKTDRKYPERIFAYEFYHQYRKVMENKNYYCGLFLNGEQRKDYQVADYIGDFAPDLVLHSRLDFILEGGQKWLCEIKMMDSVNPLSDIVKFREMETLLFDNYIFLYAGSCFANFLLKINYKLNKGIINKESDGSCICICSYYGRTSKLHIECHRLSTLIDIVKEINMSSLRKRSSYFLQAKNSIVKCEPTYIK